MCLGQAKSIEARWTDQPILLDGDLSEPDWGLARPVSDFVQVEPREGDTPSERTQVRVLFNQDTLYIGAYLYDSEPEGILINDLRRDFQTREGDVFGVVLDAFHSQRITYAFFTNPAGAKQDSEGLADGRYINLPWDGIWYTASRLQHDGWSCEIAIPLKTLRFSDAENRIMGINFKRRIRRKHEDLYWSLVPRRHTIHRVSMGGELHLDRNLRPVRNLQVKPFGIFPVTSNRIAGTSDTDFDPEVGIDVKYSLTPGLTLDGTYNTDFSQVEVDAEQINLTRFSLFFPEKRDFFLENADLFQLGDVPMERGGARTAETQLFYSRRIGLSDSGTPLPLLGGARLSGRMGPAGLGLLNIHQQKTDASPSSNFTVLRLRYDVMENSDVGAILVNREGSESGDYNRAYGLDANLRFFEDLSVNSFLAATNSPGLSGNNRESKISAHWDDGFLEVRGIFADIGENFNPEVGFVPRRGVRNYHLNAGIRPRPSGGSLIREIYPHVNLKHYTDRDDVTLTKDLHFAVAFRFADRTDIEISHNPAFERLEVPFEIREGITIGPGDYHFNRFRVRYISDQSQLLSGTIDYNRGSFFDGDRTTLVLLANLLFKPRFSTQAGYTYNSVEFAKEGFRADLYSLRLNYSFNPRITADLFVQYNKDTGRILTNARFNWIHRPLSDLSIVLTEERFSELSQDVSRALILKYTHLLQF